MTVLNALRLFFVSQLFHTPKYPMEDFTGQTIIVTGSNGGLGLEAARHIFRLKCSKLIIAVRTLSKGERAKESILASTTRTDPEAIEVWELDLSSNASVKAFAARAQSLDRVDALIENAGVNNNIWIVHEGFESNVQVNVISTMLLALLMLPKLRETAEKYRKQTHLEIVTSELHRFASLKEADEGNMYAKLNEEETFNALERYPITKLLEVLFVLPLVTHHLPTSTSSVPQPIITLVNPGFCYSNLGADTIPTAQRISTNIVRFLLARTTEVGSRCLVAGISCGDESHGCFMSDGSNQAVEEWITETERGRRVQTLVWEETMKILERIEPGISKNVGT